MDIIWDGANLPGLLSEEYLARRNDLAKAAKFNNWPRVIEILADHPYMANSTRPGGSSLYAPLHQAAHWGASVEVIHQLLSLGAWRTLRTMAGEQPIDIAKRRRHAHILEPLIPIYKHHVKNDELRDIQAQFHSVILDRTKNMELEANLRLPELEPLLELNEPKMWFSVPGMYGGFSYWLEFDTPQIRLISESWCRVMGGSGQKHVVTSAGSELVDEGFV